MKTKRCPKCKETKPVSGFYRNRSRKDGLSYECKMCRNESYKNNREEIAKRQHRYYENNKEKVKERTRRYQEANNKKLAEYRHRWYQDNKKQVIRYSKARNKKINELSLELAHRKRCSWEDWEDEFVMADNGLTNYQKAVKLGRSLHSVVNRKIRLRKKLVTS